MFIPVVFQIKVVENWKTLNDWNWLLLHLLKQIAVAVTFDWLLMASLLRLFVCATSAEFLWLLNQGECYLNRLWVPYCHQTYFCHLLAVQHVSLNTNDQISTQALCVALHRISKLTMAPVQSDQTNKKSSVYWIIIIKYNFTWSNNKIRSKQYSIFNFFVAHMFEHFQTNMQHFTQTSWL